MPRFVVRTLHDSSEITIRRVGCDGADGVRVDDETISRTSVWVLLAGRFRLRSRPLSTVVDPTAAMQVAAGEEYRVTHQDGGPDVCLSISGPLVERIAGDRMARRPIDDPGYTVLQDLARRLSSGAMVTPLEAEETVVTALAGAPAPPLTRPDREAIGAVIDAIHARYDAKLSLGELADLAGVSVFHLCRVFKRARGTSIHRYQNGVRLRHALALILGSDRSLVDVAIETGFASQSHLTNQFGRRFGMSPGRARSDAGRRALASR